MISALEETDSVVRCIEMGADDHLPKPFNPVLLRARLNAGFARKRLHDMEREYLKQVHRVADAAAALEAGSFETDSLDPVASRDDALGLLARVFQRMAQEVVRRERRLRAEVDKLRIEVNETRTIRQVEEITGTDFFRELEQRVELLRNPPGE
jgi:DNA-binding response OmpR family regulator